MHHKNPRSTVMPILSQGSWFLHNVPPCRGLTSDMTFLDLNVNSWYLLCTKLSQNGHVNDQMNFLSLVSTSTKRAHLDHPKKPFWFWGIYSAKYKRFIRQGFLTWEPDVLRQSRSGFWWRKCPNPHEFYLKLWVYRLWILRGGSQG